MRIAKMLTLALLVPLSACGAYGARSTSDFPTINLQLPLSSGYQSQVANRSSGGEERQQCQAYAAMRQLPGPCRWCVEGGTAGWCAPNAQGGDSYASSSSFQSESGSAAAAYTIQPPPHGYNAEDMPIPEQPQQCEGKCYRSADNLGWVKPGSAPARIVCGGCSVGSPLPASRRHEPHEQHVNRYPTKVASTPKSTPEVHICPCDGSEKGGVHLEFKIDNHSDNHATLNAAPPQGLMVLKPAAPKEALPQEEVVPKTESPVKGSSVHIMKGKLFQTET